MDSLLCYLRWYRQYFKGSGAPNHTILQYRLQWRNYLIEYIPIIYYPPWHHGNTLHYPFSINSKEESMSSRQNPSPVYVCQSMRTPPNKHLIECVRVWTTDIVCVASVHQAACCHAIVPKSIIVEGMKGQWWYCLLRFILFYLILPNILIDLISPSWLIISLCVTFNDLR